MAFTEQDVREGITRLVIESNEGDLTPEAVAAACGLLADLGYTSLSFVRMLDAIENDFGVYIDLEQEQDSGRLRSLDGLVRIVLENLELGVD